MGVFDAIRNAEQSSDYGDKFNRLAQEAVTGEYDDEPGMKSGRYDEFGRRRSDGRKRIQGYTTAQRYKTMADRERRITSAMNALRGKWR